MDGKPGYKKLAGKQLIKCVFQIRGAMTCMFFFH